MEGYYSIAEVADDSYKRPDRTILCNLFNDDGAVFESHRKAELQKVAKLVISNGGTPKKFFGKIGRDERCFHFLRSPP